MMSGDVASSVWRTMEICELVVGYLPITAQRRVMLVNRQTHEITTRCLYREVKWDRVASLPTCIKSEVSTIGQPGSEGKADDSMSMSRGQIKIGWTLTLR